MASLLEQLRSYTKVVADSGDINSIEKFKPQDSTTNPSLIEAAAQMPAYQQIVDDVLKQARKDAGDKATDKEVAALAFKSLAVAFGRKILDIVPGRVSTEGDARLSFDTEKTIEQATTSSPSTTRPASRATACSSRSPPPGRASRPPNASSRKASTAT